MKPSDHFNTKFIAHSRTDIPKLLEALDIAVLELECFRGEGSVDEALARIKELDEKA